MAIVEVIKYNGGPDIFAWKYPSEELGTWSSLIVNESQEAILFKGGKALDVFQSGRHTLETANIPILNNIINLPFGGRSPFTAEVWYINKISSLDIKWGTSSPIQLQDPKYSIFVPVRAFGQFGIRIDNSKQFLVKLVGTLGAFDKENIIQYFRGLYLTKAKDAISSYLIHKQISITQINSYIDELSEHLMERIKPTFKDYGIDLINFYVNDISVPEDDQAVIQLKSALAKKAEMDIIGYNYQQERSFDTLEGAAKNTGSAANLMGAGMGLGIGMSVGGAMGNQFGEITKEINTSSQNDTLNKQMIICSDCGNKYESNTKFCPECGSKYIPCPECGADLNENSPQCKSCNYNTPLPCPGCGSAINDNDAKFCPECGQALVKSCPSCNTAINGSPKFCLECGQKLG